jgi:AcrR family transcriptional regulator
MTATAAPVRRSQAERRASTQRALLDAALATLVQDGHLGFTTTAVVKRAGLSQGALFRYYPRKADLLTATIEHLFGELIADFTAAADPTGAPAARVASAIEALWQAFVDPRLLAAFELYTAARTDPDLAADLQPVMDTHRANILAAARTLLPDLAEQLGPAFDDFVDLAVYALQGTALNQLASPDPTIPPRVLAALTRVATAALG